MRNLAISLHVKTRASQWLIPKKLSAANLALFFENKLNLVLLELLFAIWSEFNATQRNFLLLIINFHPLSAKARMLKKIIWFTLETKVKEMGGTA